MDTKRRKQRKKPKTPCSDDSRSTAKAGKKTSRRRAVSASLPSKWDTKCHARAVYSSAADAWESLLVSVAVEANLENVLI